MKYRFSKFLIINEFYPTSGGQCLYGSVIPPGNFPSYVNSTFALSRAGKGIFKIISMFMSANNMVFSKNQTFPSLSWTDKPVSTIT